MSTNHTYEVQRPSLAPTFWISLFFGLFGFLPADRAANQAHALGLPRERYWITMVFGWMLSGVAYGLIFMVLFSSLLFGGIASQQN